MENCGKGAWRGSLYHTREYDFDTAEELESVYCMKVCTETRRQFCALLHPEIQREFDFTKPLIQ